MTTTDNLGLNLHSKGTDNDKSFEEYRLDLNGPTDSNMTIFDAYSMALPILLANFSSDASGSTAAISGSLSNMSGSIPSFTSSSATIESRFKVLGTFSGSGQADFTSIDQNFTNILIIGTAVSQASGSYYYVCLDFDGDSSGSSYKSTSWYYSGSAASGSATVSSSDSFENTTGSYIPIARTWGNIWYNPFGNAFLAIIPNYSGSSALYKSAFGYFATTKDIFQTTPFNLEIGVLGGMWQNLNTINRIRIFTANSLVGSKGNFSEGTSITLYGLI